MSTPTTKPIASGRDLTACEVARLFHVSTKTVYDWADKGLVPGAWRTPRPSGHRRFPQAGLRAMCAKFGIPIPKQLQESSSGQDAVTQQGLTPTVCDGQQENAEAAGRPRGVVGD